MTALITITCHVVQLQEQVHRYALSLMELNSLLYQGVKNKKVLPIFCIVFSFVFAFYSQWCSTWIRATDSPVQLWWGLSSFIITTTVFHSEDLTSSSFDIIHAAVSPAMLFLFHLFALKQWTQSMISETTLDRRPVISDMPLLVKLGYVSYIRKVYWNVIDIPCGQAACRLQRGKIIFSWNNLRMVHFGGLFDC